MEVIVPTEASGNIWIAIKDGIPNVVLNLIEDGTQETSIPLIDLVKELITFNMTFIDDSEGEMAFSDLSKMVGELTQMQDMVNEAMEKLIK